MFRDLSRRDLQPEVMDRPDLERDRHETALAGLARVNTLSQIAASIWRPIGAEARRHGWRELTLCDIACGSGDVGLGLIRCARRDGIRLHLTGYDVSPTAIEQARARAAAATLEARFEVRDVLAEPLDGPFDVITCSLFLHHLAERQAAILLMGMRTSARKLVVINDLRRSRIGYAAAHVVCRLVTQSDVVHYDGPQSVAAAFNLDEVRRLAESAGMNDARLRKTWPFRFLLTWEPSS